MGLSYENMEKLARLKKKYLFPPEDTEIFRDLKTVAEGYTFLESWKEKAVVLDHGKQTENRNCSKGVRRIRIGVKLASFFIQEVIQYKHKVSNHLCGSLLNHPPFPGLECIHDGSLPLSYGVNYFSDAQLGYHTCQSNKAWGKS